MAAWLNSTWMRAAARAVADPARGGFARFNARVVGSLPLPLSVPDDAKLAHLARLGAQGAIVQDAIDAHCAELLDLPQSARETLASVATAGGGHCSFHRAMRETLPGLSQRVSVLRDRT